MMLWEKSWRWLLGGGRARPVALPGRLRTRLLVAAPTLRIAGYEVRCLQVQSDDGQAPRLEFVDGVPHRG